MPLHRGRAPQWLFQRMKRLAREIVVCLVSEYGPQEVLRRLSDPFWFQAFGCVLGFDWHSSGVTTTVCGAVKEGIKGLEQELGIFAAGGKGAVSRRTPGEITAACNETGIECDPLVYASRLSAKVDSAAVQDGYQLYHHAFFFTRSGEWCVVQQGMNDVGGTARRYHWQSETLQSFVNEPHAAVCCDRKGIVLNLVASESASVRRNVVELASTPDRDTLATAEKLPGLILPARHRVVEGDINPRYLRKILLRTYENPPADFEQLLGFGGVGPQTLRALALVSELIFGTPASTRDPARFSFAHGGKDGIPYPVDRATYDRTIGILSHAVEKAKIEGSEKTDALKRLAKFEMIK